jgi:tRNA pseudouridine32 synthase / 23S rRNA pseudouridine746 synthase
MLVPDYQHPLNFSVEDVFVHYEDEHLLIVEKPAGLLTVPGRGLDKQQCLISLMSELYPGALIVHRLDMATSGLVVLARSKLMQQQLSGSFASRSVQKQYHAVVMGERPFWFDQLDQPDDWFDIHLPLIADWPNRPRQKVDWEIGKPSHTRVKWLGPHGVQGSSRVLLSPITGRSHQLRVHLLTMGHPIVGDALYAPASAPGDSFGVVNSARRLHLHASSIRFNHPVHGHLVTAMSTPPFFADSFADNPD